MQELYGLLTAETHLQPCQLHSSWTLVSVVDDVICKYQAPTSSAFKHELKWATLQRASQWNYITGPPWSETSSLLDWATTGLSDFPAFKIAIGSLPSFCSCRLGQWAHLLYFLPAIIWATLLCYTFRPWWSDTDEIIDQNKLSLSFIYFL